jgi:hypothetical protein
VALITPIQYTGARSGGTTNTLALAFTSDVTAGNVLIVAAGCWFTHNLVDPPTDSQGNVYTARTFDFKIGFWSAVALSTGPCTVTVTLQLGLTEWVAMGLAELPAGTYSYSDSALPHSGNTDTTPSTGAMTVTEDGAALFGFLTCQGNPSGTLTEDGAWTSIANAPTYGTIPYSFMFRNADIGSYTADWTVGGGGITTYRWGIVVEGTPTPPTKVGCFILGGTDTGASNVDTTHTGYIALDDVARTVSGEGVAFLGGYLGLIEQASDPSPIANTALVYAKDNGSGKTKLMVQFPTGSPIQLSIEV